MANMTSNDVLNSINKSEALVGIITEVIQKIPELNFFAASPVKRNDYYTLCVTGDPSVAFRATTEERTWQTATLGTKRIQCKYLDASWMLQCAIAEQADWGKETAIAIQQQAHFRAALKKIAVQTWYGTDADSKGFNGLKGIISAVDNAQTDNGTMVVDAGGANGSNGSSVFAVRTGLDSIQYAWGSEGLLTEGDIQKQIVGTATKGAWYYVQELGGWVGLQVTSRNAAAMITKLTPSKGLTDDLLYELLGKFPAGEGPDAIFLSRRSLEQLRKSRTATNATGAPAPIPTEIEGVPLIATDAISNTETISS